MASQLAQVEVNLSGRAIADLIHEPDISEPWVRLAIALLQDIWIAAYIAGA